ncbi:Carboxylesterase family-domain-containing protein [Lasiosphaeris hirsuta]|uniref:Carboxylesterase family-domain-containing protein n=1 Tax=Lasiosphaeris hirsuta TaxID=260670 RepID=A0AA40A301_9PEZI|nr:Carboxylesterase family-domain-containing protein [Lasiosphaeris hirsuta]
MSSSWVLSLLFLQLFSLVSCSPLPLGISYQKQSALPILTLPYASYRAASYRSASDIYVFKNIRFAAAPVGNLRWAKPAPPPNNSTLQDGTYGPKCIQSAVSGMNLVGSGNTSPIGAAVNQFLGGIPIPLFTGGSEDCLFLDVYVPGKALNNPSLKLPVAVWIYGGAYLFGSKDTLQPELPFYDGSGIMGQANGNMIFVAMNYRLGSYGFLAGTTMEQEGTPNAGLHDQRAAFQWVRDYIHLVGGDPTQVTAMGESAGAGSIVHHVVAEGGKLDPLFSKAILQSPAFQPIWDRAGSVEDIFSSFAALAGCRGKGLACLRAAEPAVLAKANKELNLQQRPGSFAVGPTPDGSFIRQMPLLELSTGNFWQGVESMILSHTADEASLFVGGAVQTDAQFSAFLDASFPNYTRSEGVSAKVEAFYPPVGAKKPKYSTQAARVTAFLRDSCFTCNVRYLTEALGDSRVWNMQYSVYPGFHGTDLVPTFFSSAFAADTPTFLDDLALLMAPGLAAFVTGISTAMQSYFASYITTGNPNTNRVVWNMPPTVQWNHPSSGGGLESIQGVVNVGDWGFGTIGDVQNQKTPCDFWRGFAAAVTALGGYAPPGAVVAQGLVDVRVDASRNYNYRGSNGNGGPTLRAPGLHSAISIGTLG